MKISERRYDIDTLRVLAVFLLIFFHTAILFDQWISFHLQNNELSIEFALFVRFINIWHMPLFFLLAGMSSFYALQNKTGNEYAKERVKRLLIPLLFGILIIVPPQVYIERIAWWCTTRDSPINFVGSFLEFYPQFFIPLYPNGNFSWHHLWFLAYLLLYSIIALPIFQWLKKDKGKEYLSKKASSFEKGKSIFLIAIPLIVVNILTRWLFPSSHDLISDWANHLDFFLIFVIGFIIVSDKRLEDSIYRNKRLAFFLAFILSISILMIDFFMYINNQPFSIIEYLPYTAIWHFCKWCWLIAFIGYARKYFSIENRFINYASEIALPFYILHQTIIIIIGFFIIQTDLSIIAKFIIISTSALFITLILCILIKSNNTTRFMFGMKIKKKRN